jgi:hypothetical protein
MGHVGLFVTATCPSRFHAVLHGKGEVNPKYIKAGSPDPVAGQAWLNGNWARTRAQNGRDGVAPYGFRIAEPHHDGTPHWHMLVFMPRADVEKFVRNMSAHWLADSGDEPGAKSNRIKFVEIDPAKGTAAGYIMKYIGKNIDDSQGAAFDEEGAVDLAGDRPIAPCQRVDAWASVWGIRQFQPLGMPPVTVWRELRRVKEQHAEAPEFIQRALLACHKRTDPETGEVGAIAADFAEYIRAQGGVNVGRDYRIMLAWKGGYAPGRYGVTVRNVPGGVVARGAWGTLYPSKRYAWERAGRVAGVGVPRSPLNNCTQQEGAPEPKAWPNRPTGADCWFSEQSLPVEALEAFVDEWFGSAECAEFVVDPWIVGQEWHQAEVAAAEIRENTVWTHLTGTARLEAAGNNGGSMWN